MLRKIAGVSALGLLCGACAVDNPFYIDPTTATTTMATATATATGVGTSTTSDTTRTTAPLVTGESSGWGESSGDPVACGNGILEGGEECDLGPDNGKDECNSTCHFAYCGDGEVAPSESCDDGVDSNGTKASDCTSWCDYVECGDAEIGAGEECDDGENNKDEDSYTCLADCIKNTCGDGFVSPDEECDPKLDPVNIDFCHDTQCYLKKCGNGEVEMGYEQCELDMDGCLPNCMFEPGEIGFVGPENDIGGVGDEGGVGEKVDCAGLALVGGRSTFDLDYEVFGQLGGICGERESLPSGQFGYFVNHFGFEELPLVGTEPSDYDEISVQCPPEHTLVGVASSGDEHLSAVTMLCSRVTLVAILDEWKIFFQAALPPDGIGVDKGLPVEFVQCPPGRAVSSLTFHTDGDGVLGIGVGCRKLGFL